MCLYRPIVKKGINWKCLLSLVSIIEDSTKIDVTSKAIATYCEAVLENALQTGSPISHNTLKNELEKVRAFLERLQ